ncbi:MAG: CPBP family intramembrane metalloprotease [Chloracidobacterium sp.]|nr:CPBP family intramembrane metalloprotease [Chloracidobacterium sp.]
MSVTFYFVIPAIFVKFIQKRKLSEIGLSLKIEPFFRGFLVHSLKPSLGVYSILAMTVPYTMIHFQKPMPETFAAIFAGLFLGWISYKNGTIWLGLVLHCTVAFSMDILALYNKGLLF